MLKHPDVQDSAVIGVPSDEHGELPRAYIVLKPGVQESAEKADEIRKFLDGLVTPLKRLRGGVEFRSAIPRNPSGMLLNYLASVRAYRFACLLFVQVKSSVASSATSSRPRPPRRPSFRYSLCCNWVELE